MEMATNTTFRYGLIGLCGIIYNLPNFKLMQEIITYIIVVLAVAFIVRKYIFPSKKKKGCSSGCGC
ncbi:FeoB-associated Cys-rich membrane protein [Polaribacter butkevichii]|uniref:FeoB-associated Cys-rich membrane protein n=1 Tax=Polaribacter butkevichii TaxID=218490 RepID=UPI0030FA5D10